MSTLTIKISSKADAMIATLQKEIFNRRRKKVTVAGVVETLVESAAKSQSDKRYAASWKNLIKDIEKAAKQTELHGNKPANISSEEWALVLSHRSRTSTTTKSSSVKGTKASRQKQSKRAATTKKTKATDVQLSKSVSTTEVSHSASTTKPRKARRARRANRASSEK